MINKKIFVFSLSAVVCLISPFSASATSTTDDILKYTRFQEQLVSSDSKKSTFASSCDSIAAVDIGFIADFFLTTLGKVNELIDKSEEVPSAYYLPSHTFEFNTAKVFVEYPNNKNETIVLSWYLISGYEDYTIDNSVYIDGDELRPNHILIQRYFNNGEKHSFTLSAVSRSLGVNISGNGFYFGSSQQFNCSSSDVSNPCVFGANPFITNIYGSASSQKNNCKYTLYTYSEDYDYRLLDKSGNIIDYPTDNQIIGSDSNYIRIQYKNKNSSSWSSSNISKRRISYFYISALYNNRDSSTINNETFYYTTLNSPGLTVYNCNAPNYNTQNFFDNKNVTYNSDTNHYELDLDSLIDDLKLALPDVDAYLKPTYSFQPSIDGSFKLPLDFDYLDIFNQLVPGTTGGSGGGGCNWITPTYTAINTKPIISSGIYSIEPNTLDAATISNSSKVFSLGWSTIKDLFPEIFTISLILMLFGLLWRFTGG